MTNEKLLEYAQSALTTLEQGNVKGASNDLRILLAGLIQAKTALEADPLAVLFEGWISDNELSMTAKELASGYTYLRLSRNREHATDHAVTFTITPRKVEPDAA